MNIVVEQYKMHYGRKPQFYFFDHPAVYMLINSNEILIKYAPRDIMEWVVMVPELWEAGIYINIYDTTYPCTVVLRKRREGDKQWKGFKLEEAIRYHEEEAQKLKEHKKDIEIILGAEKYKEVLEEHRQYAEWLKELAERRELPEIIRCRNCTDWGTNDCAMMSQTVDFSPDYDWTNPDGYCHMAERRNDG